MDNSSGSQSATASSLYAWTLLRRCDKNQSGRIEADDLKAAYLDYWSGLLSGQELDYVFEAFRVGVTFMPRRVQWRLRDYTRTPLVRLHRRPYGITVIPGGLSAQES